VVVGLRDLPTQARVLDDAAPTLLLRTRSVPEVLDALAERGIVSVLLEGGPALAGAFLAAGAVDRVTWYIAPMLLGSGATAVSDAGVRTLTEALRLDVDSLAVLDGDVRVSGLIRQKGD
jgi:diaminohydroxyphosphoribosylaminopyrimidine deaminase/5-amino-6-(5-phosphoribosylamino)uracil reductase